MKASRGFLLIVALAMGWTEIAHAQAAMNQVRLAAAMTSESQNTAALTVADSVAVGDVVYIDTEAMLVQAVNTTTDVVTVGRGQMGTAATPHLSGALAWTGVATRFYFYDPPYGRCVAAQAYPGGAQPWINILTGRFSYCNENLFGRTASVPGNWFSTSLSPAEGSVYGYTPIAYRTSRTSGALVITPAYTAKVTDVLIASLTYSGPFEVFLPAPTGLLGKKITVHDVAGLNSNAATSTAGRTMTIRGVFPDGEGTVTLANWQHFEAQPGFTTARLVGAFASTSFFVGITSNSTYHWFTAPW